MRTILAWMLFLGVVPTAGTLLGDDIGWVQPGVRVWYVGIGASYSGQQDAEEANLIEQAGGPGLHVVRHSGVAFWDSPLPVNTFAVPDPASEGPFWISPRRLRGLRPPDAFNWQGLSLVVKARVTHQDPGSLPFLALLPVQALYSAKAPRELITLTGENDGVVGDYFFDVETGLGLSTTLATPGFYILMFLSEINYDFATHRAFAEDDGPHSGFRARQMAGRVDFPINQFYLFEERVTSRHGDQVRADLSLSINNIASGQSFHGDYHSLFDGMTRQFWIAPITGAAGIAADLAWTQNGSHGFYWVPRGDRARDSIRVWDLELTRREPVEMDAVFESDAPPLDWGFTRLQLGPDGFVREMTVESPARSFNVDSRTVPAGSKMSSVSGRSYYLETMGPAVPTGSAVTQDLAVIGMKVPRKLTMKTGVPPKPGKVSVTIQNRGSQPEIVPDLDALEDLVTLEVESLGECEAPLPVLVPPRKGFPVVLAPGKKLKLQFVVAIDCANDPLPSSKTEDHSDYRFTVVVDRSALDGVGDAHPASDTCPRPPEPAAGDSGCGNKDPATGQLGADLLTDVVVK